MNRSSYANITQFGPKTSMPMDDPITYCLGDTMDQRFLHGSNADSYGQHSKQCQLYLGKRCADKWDQVCEIASRDHSTHYPNNAASCNTGIPCRGLTAGEILVYNAAREKYLVKMHGCKRKFEPFDPNVPTSPMISYWVPDRYDGTNNCIPVYEVNPDGLDKDPVMNKILAKPIIALDILINIYNTMKNKETLQSLKGTKLGEFYSVHPLFVSKGGL